MAGEKIGRAGRELRSALPRMPLCLRRNRLPGGRQRPEAFTHSSCPEMQPLRAHLYVISVIKSH